MEVKKNNSLHKKISHGPSGVSRLRLIPGLLPSEEADWTFSKLLAELPWSQKTNLRVTGEAYQEPRLTCWYGEVEVPYTYTRSTMDTNAQWHLLLVTLHSAVEKASNHRFNSLLCNLQWNSKHSIVWHSDDEATLVTQPIIASFSLGDKRAFSLRKQTPPEGDYSYMERLWIPLTHGILLMMERATQDDRQHSVAKEYHDRGPRINLTFCTMYPEPEGQTPGTGLPSPNNRHTVCPTHTFTLNTLAGTVTGKKRETDSGRLIWKPEP
ncbi:alpha-ketoglutarate-dependent dioxygenase alkB homolog 3-like [Oncorhynchus clarkii lewisi]|uniref:alpha-ketoglutarate-dependent dioxygenase alkB homolog 3-like n=1 Tax=Oncorhynchus clarkii lewisi TaxID=490388 RepID=UPI0039B94F54